MQKREITLPDGRYLIFYTFETRDLCRIEADAASTLADRKTAAAQQPQHTENQKTPDRE